MANSFLGPWHDFYAVVGTAAATLVGLMFVAASVGTGVFTHERQTGLRTFLSPTVVAFSAVLATSLIGDLPVAKGRVPGALLAGIGVLGVAYSGRVWRRMSREGITNSINFEDRVWYTLAPALAYGVLAVAGVLMTRTAASASTILAAGTCLLLFAGIRNAWDMTTWVVLRRKE